MVDMKFRYKYVHVKLTVQHSKESDRESMTMDNKRYTTMAVSKASLSQVYLAGFPCLAILLLSAGNHLNSNNNFVPLFVIKILCRLPLSQ